MLQWFRKQPVNSTASGNGGDLHIALIRKLIDFLANQISSPKRATSILSQIARFKELPPTYQEKELPSLYLKIENFLVNEDPMQKFTKSLLRKTLAYRYEPLMELENFRLIFEEDPIQEFLLSQAFLKTLMLKCGNTIANADEKFHTSMSEWIFHIPEVSHLKLPFDLKEPLPEAPREWIQLLAKISQKIYNYLEHLTGTEEAASLFEKSYREIAETYRPLETFYVVVQLLPNNLLDENKIGLLSGEQIRNVFLNKVAHLQKINEELSRKNGELRETQNELMIAQDTALESVKLLHSVLDTVGEGIVTADSTGKIILVNERIQRMFGYKEDELVGKNIEVLMPEKYREQHHKGMKRYLKTRESRALGERLVLEGLKKEQDVFPLEIQITETQIGEQIYFTAAMSDISEDLKSESELKKTYLDLRLSEQRYRSLMETLPDIVFTLSLDGIFTSLNPAFEKVTGWPREEWLGKPFTQLVHPEDSMPALKIFQKVLQGSPASLPHVRIRQNSGQFAEGQFSLTPQMQNDKMIGALGVARGKSPEIDSSEALQQAEDRYLKLVEAFPNPMGIWVDDKLAFVNQAALQLFGAPGDEALLDHPLDGFISAAGRETIREWLENIAPANGKPVSRQEKLLRLDGEEIEAEITALPVVFHGKEAIQLIFQKSEPAPRPVQNIVENDAHFQALFHNIPDAVLLTDLENQVIEANPAAGKLYHTKPEELIGHNFLKRVPINLREAINQNIYMLTHGRGDHCESVHVRMDESQFPVKMWAHRIEFRNEPAVLLVVRDISDRKQQDYDREILNHQLLEFQKRAETLQAELVELKQQGEGRENLDLQLSEFQKRAETLEAELLEAQQKVSALEVELQNVQENSEDSSSLIQELRTRHQVAQARLQNAQLKMKKLGRMIPVCGSCKKIRDDDGFWRELSEFVGSPANAELLTGVCPECEAAVTLHTSEKANNGIK